MYLSILGRQPELSLAELEARFGESAIKPIIPEAALVKTNTIDVNRLGGSQKIVEVLDSLPSPKLETLPQQLLKFLPKTKHKFDFGLSFYGRTISGYEAQHLALKVKKLAKLSDLKLRVVPNQNSALSSAQVLHNQLSRGDNVELVVVFDTKGVTHIGRTVGVQDIEAYRQRDIERPARDARVGMLPPKLAQIMLNLAQVLPDQTVLDPFCGTGVILQEALLMGTRAYGSDIAERMVHMSQTNLSWLAQRYTLPPDASQLEVTDARVRKWLPPIDTVVSEMYLGPPLSRLPQTSELDKIRREVSDLLKNTLHNLHAQLVSKTRVVLAVPAWVKQGSFVTLPVVDLIERLGYTAVSFKHSEQPLIYAREGQIVARQLLVLERN